MHAHGRLLFFGLLLLCATASADDWPHTKRATGDWGGRRTWLKDHGFEIELQYTAETFARLTEDPAARYRGNVDLILVFTTEKMGLWPGGELWVYAENGHGPGISSQIDAQTLVTSLEAPDFTQIEELIYTQTVGDWLTVKLGKQDTNADFAAPRFPGNFVNSSFGAPPPVPLPTFPAPGVGAAAFIVPVEWLEARLGVYEAAPEIETFGGKGFDEGVLALGSLLLRHSLGGKSSAEHSAGLFHSTADDRTGFFAVTDSWVRLDDRRSFQGFVRGAIAPESDGAAHAYVGGGATAHGFLGEDNTLGLGFGHVRYTGGPRDAETFIELFFKWRPLDWLTFEPDVQLYFLDGRTEVVGGMRSKLKL